MDLPARNQGGAPRIGVSMGDPGGIGPEVVVAALVERLDEDAQAVVWGDSETLKRAAVQMKVATGWGVALQSGRVIIADETETEHTGTDQHGPSAAGGRNSFRWVERAIESALLPAGNPGRVDAVVTGPISKQAWSIAGHGKYPGHTELLAERCGSDRWAMMFVSPRLRVILATTHIPLARVAGELTSDRILEVIELGARACERLGVASPRVAVLGLNPHAGEGGLIGREDDQVIAPAIERACKNGIDATGPHPADTLFSAALNGRYDLVVAMYHDQGLIPVKLLDRDEAVNVTVGLPIVRTSPDHGTAYDIAGKGVANPGSMSSSLRLAIQLAKNGPLAHPGRQQSAPDAQT